MGLSNIIYKSKISSRVAVISINNKKLITPTYFPSISSYGVKYALPNLVSFLTSYSYPRLLISAYDYYFSDSGKKDNLLHIINDYGKKGGVLFVDSGVFESSWKVDTEWTFELYEMALSQIDCDFYSSFDIHPNSQTRIEEFEKETIKNILDSQSLTKQGAFIPIIHGSNPDQVVSILTRIVELHPNSCNMIAVAERDCGKDIIEKATTIRKIRQILDKNKRCEILHILGCGHPTSLAVFSYCGADTFDSLDWIKCAIDPNRLAFNDFSHLELTNCDCSICTGKDRDYIEKVFLHNLKFYQDFMSNIQSLIRTNQISGFICELLGEEILRKIDNENSN